MALGTMAAVAGDAWESILPEPPSDTVSSVAWSPKGDYLVAGSWDKTVRCWEIPQGVGKREGVARAMTTLPQPVLAVCWHNTEFRAFAAGCDNQVYAWDLGTNQTMVIGKHDAPVKSIFYAPELNCVVAGSWDKTIRYWDARQPREACKFQAEERIYSMALRGRLLVAATAPGAAVAQMGAQPDKGKVLIFDISNPQTLYRADPSDLGHQMRCVEVWHNSAGYLAGSIEGRVAVHSLQDVHPNKTPQFTFTFKCHRSTTGGSVPKCYPVNAMSVHPDYGTFVTVGGDGGVSFWDKENKSKLSSHMKQQPITTAAYNECANNARPCLLAIAEGYDWQQGHNSQLARQPAKITVRGCSKTDIEPKKKN
ncbi:unnamed protein product [Pedinophyceae sp. YPF-701]|nr:unnamed protein product [Pedinophyceae sp. YPF-701]